MPYLLDTNIVSDLIRNPKGRVATRIEKVGEAQIAVSVIVAAELRFGVAKGGSPLIADKVESLLKSIKVLSLEPPADACYATIRARLQSTGAPISGNDMLIAAHAMAVGYTLVTDNVREFSRIRNLKVENWLR